MSSTESDLQSRFLFLEKFLKKTAQEYKENYVQEEFPLDLCLIEQFLINSLNSYNNHLVSSITKNKKINFDSNNVSELHCFFKAFILQAFLYYLGRTNFNVLKMLQLFIQDLPVEESRQKSILDDNQKIERWINVFLEPKTTPDGFLSFDTNSYASFWCRYLLRNETLGKEIADS